MTIEFFTTPDLERWAAGIKHSHSQKKKRFITVEGEFSDVISNLIHTTALSRLEGQINIACRSISPVCLYDDKKTEDLCRKMRNISDEFRYSFFTAKGKRDKNNDRYTTPELRALFLVRTAALINQTSILIPYVRNDLSMISERNSANVSTRNMEKITTEVKNLAAALNDCMWHLDQDDFQKLMNLSMTDRAPIAGLTMPELERIFQNIQTNQNKAQPKKAAFGK